MGLGLWSLLMMLSTEFGWQSTTSDPARFYAASFDTEDVLQVGAAKVQPRCIRSTMDADPDSMETVAPRAISRPFRRALDDADLNAPPDPPRFLRLTLDD